MHGENVIEFEHVKVARVLQVLLTSHIPGTIASFGSKNGDKKHVVQEQAAKEAVRRSTRNREPSPTPKNGNSEGWCAIF